MKNRDDGQAFLPRFETDGDADAHACRQVQFLLRFHPEAHPEELIVIRLLCYIQ
ncbi:MAG: hypothetical protein ACLTZT_11835 [Butyricimonas faecalis]